MRSIKEKKRPVCWMIDAGRDFTPGQDGERTCKLVLSPLRLQSQIPVLVQLHAVQLTSSEN